LFGGKAVWKFDALISEWEKVRTGKK